MYIFQEIQKLVKIIKFMLSSIGNDPQDLKFKGEETKLKLVTIIK